MKKKENLFNLIRYLFNEDCRQPMLWAVFLFKVKTLDSGIECNFERSHKKGIACLQYHNEVILI